MTIVIDFLARVVFFALAEFLVDAVTTRAHRAAQRRARTVRSDLQSHRGEQIGADRRSTPRRGE